MTIPPIEHAPRETINRFQEEKLQRLLAYLQANSAHYQQVFRTHGIDIGSVRTLDDLAHLPFTTKEHLQQENIPVTILPGQETRINGEMLADDENSNILTLNDTNRYVFVEFPPNDVPAYTSHLFFDLKMKGLIPVIVHPERNRAIIEKPNRLYRLIKDGSLSQVTAASIVGKFGKKIQEFSLKLIEHSLVHFIASDAHNVSSRSFHMREAYQEISKEFGFDVADEFQMNAKRLMNGDDIYVHEPVEFRTRKKKFRFF